MMPRMTTPTMAAAATISPTSGPGSVGALPTREQARPRTDRHRCGLSRWMCLPRTSPRRGHRCQWCCYRLGEAYSEDDTAYGGGGARRWASFLAFCSAPEMLVPEREWVRSLWDALRPHSDGPRRLRQPPR